MTREIDVNSGAAPQPGGWAGPEGAARGHALPSHDTEVEQVQGLDEPLDMSKSDSDAGVPDADDEQEAVKQAAIEHQGVDPEEKSSDEEKDDEPKEAPAKKAAAKKAPAKKAAKKS